MELRQAASGLVKVICRTEDSRPNGRGKKPGKPKQKGLLASFEEWFGSINIMNILYVWFPASWGPSVVEAIQTRNVTCLAKKPIVRDPHIFDRKEAFHPILVANARVDWLAMDDDDITKKFPILLKGILQDVYSQRAASAWQGAQPQNLRCQCSSQGPALRQNGEIYYNPDANSGLHLPLGMPLLSR